MVLGCCAFMERGESACPHSKKASKLLAGASLPENRWHHAILETS